MAIQDEAVQGNAAITTTLTQSGTVPPDQTPLEGMRNAAEITLNRVTALRVRMKKLRIRLTGAEPTAPPETDAPEGSRDGLFWEIDELSDRIHNTVSDLEAEVSRLEELL